MNSVLVHDSENIPVRLIGKTNQTLGLQLMQDLNDPEAQILKVVIMAITPLGRHTEAEFYEGMDRKTGKLN